VIDGENVGGILGDTKEDEGVKEGLGWFGIWGRVRGIAGGDLEVFK